MSGGWHSPAAREVQASSEAFSSLSGCQGAHSLPFPQQNPREQVRLLENKSRLSACLPPTGHLNPLRQRSTEALLSAWGRTWGRAGNDHTRGLGGSPRLQCEAVSGEGRKYNPFCCKDTAVVTVSNFRATFSQMRAFLLFSSFLLQVTARPWEGRGLFCLCFCTEGSHLTSQTLQLLLPPSFQHRLQNKKM